MLSIALKTISFLQHFEREYADLVGQPLRHRQFGFGRLEDLLSAMPDAVRPVRLNTGEILVRAVTSDSTAHIASLVGRQKASDCRY